MPIQRNDPAPMSLKPVVELVGPTGSVGAVGQTGPEGAAVTGDTGPRGETGLFGTGPTGPAAAAIGPTGPRGATGPPDDASSFGPTGWWGDWGDYGPTGITGPPGRTGSDGFGGGPAGVSGTTGPAGAGSYGGLQSPFFADNEVYLTTPYLHRINSDSISYYQVTNSVISLVPVFVPFPRTFTELIIDSYQGRVSGVYFRLAIYDCDNNMHPTVPLIESPDMQVGGQGRIGFSFSGLALVAKPYYLALITNLYGLYFRGFSVDQVAVMSWRKYADNTQWMFEACKLKYSASGYGYSTGFINLTSMTSPNLDFDSGAIPILGMR